MMDEAEVGEMSAVDAEIHIPTIQQATFLALWEASAGIYFFVTGGNLFLTTGVNVASVATLLGAVALFGVAVFTYLRPESLRSGTDPTPRSWFVLAAVFLFLFAIGVVIVAL